MTTDDLQIIRTDGSPVERARQFGEAVRDGLQEYLELTAPSLRHFASPAGQRLRENLLAAFYALDPPMELVRAFCMAAGTEPEVLIERAASFSAGKSKLNVECSGLLLRKGGRVVMGQNLDTGTECGVCNYFEIGHGPDTEGYARFCWPDVLSWMHGISPHGVCTTGCSGPAGEPMGEGMGLPVLLARWEPFYRCRTPRHVADGACAHRVVGKGVNAIFASADGSAVKAEIGGGEVGLHWPEDACCVATGYRQHIRGEGLGANPPEKAAAERARWERLMHLAGEATDRESDPVDDLKHMLADHHVTGGHPHSSPCRHDETSCTQFSFIYDLTLRAVHHCGQPCCNEWRVVEL